MSDEKQEIVIPEKWRSLYRSAKSMEAETLRLETEREHWASPAIVHDYLATSGHSRIIALINELTAAEADLAKSKQAFEALRIADQATLTETLAAALEQSLRAEKAEAERDEARKQVQHLEDEQRVRRDVLEERFPENWSAMSDEDMKEDAEYSETCKCFLCQWVRYELSRREQMIRICEQRDAAIELAAWRPITDEWIPKIGYELFGMMMNLNGGTYPDIVTILEHELKDKRSYWEGYTHYRAINAPSIVADGEKP